MNVNLNVQWVEYCTPGQKTLVLVASGLDICTSRGDGRRSGAGTARGPGEAGDWVDRVQLSGTYKFGLASARQQEFCDWTVEVGTGATNHA